MCRNCIHSSAKIAHIYCNSITLKMCTSNVLPMYIFAVLSLAKNSELFSWLRKFLEKKKLNLIKTLIVQSNLENLKLCTHFGFE